MSTDTSALRNDYTFEQIKDYEWDDDHEFQEGLKSILTSELDPARRAHLTLRAQCFYYSRYIMPRIIHLDLLT